jgi:hypothetical protein
MKEFFADRRPHDGLTYDAYRADWKARKDAPVSKEGDAEARKAARKAHHYLNYNWERQRHVHDAYTPSDELREAVARIAEDQLWMVLTEPWCGDSAFCLPVIAEAAALSERVTLHILPRDAHLDIMDQYLTGGTSRSIPKLVAFTREGTERFTWGPRPVEGQALFDESRREGLEKPQIVQRLVDWYNDGGFARVDEELAQTIALEAA